MTFQVVGFGALNLDKLYQVNKIAREDGESFIKSVSESCGGSAANTIIGLSRLEMKTVMIGKVASDREGELLLDNLSNENVQTTGIIKAEDGRSGTVMGFVDEAGERALYVDPGVNDLITLDEIDLNLVYNTEFLHLTSFVGNSIKAQEELLEKLPTKVKISLDPGRLYAEKGINSLVNILKRTDILLINRAELKLLTNNKYKTIEEEIKSLENYNIAIKVVKLGEDGCYATDGDKSYSLKAFPVKCRDTTGAGDAFNSGFLYGHIKGLNLEKSCIIGNYVASCCVGGWGGINSLPYKNNLDEFLKTI
jgi:ribokinase